MVGEASPLVEDENEVRESSKQWLPPVAPLVLTLWILVSVLHFLLPAVGVEVPSALSVVSELSIIAAVAGVSWQFRRAVVGSSKQEVWDAWEAPRGTAGLAAIVLIASVASVFWCILAGWLWLGVSVSAVLISLLAVRWATIGHPSEPVTVIPDGEQPEPLEDFQRVELTWTLAPGLSGVEGFIALWIRKARLAEFRDANPHKMWAGDLPKYDWYVDNGICDEINTLADRLTAVSRQRGLTKYLEVCLVLNLVQRIRYAYDQDSKGIAEYWRFPLETLADGCGDCEDFAILAVALLSAMGHETCFFDLPGHVATGVAALPEETGVSFEATDGKRFFFVETTAEGWHIGELPNDITRDSVRVAAVVAPLRGRQSDRTLQSVPSGQWRIDGKVLLRAWLIVGLAGSALSLGLHWVSIVS